MLNVKRQQKSSKPQFPPYKFADRSPIWSNDVLRIVYYFDVVAVWLKNPLSKARQQWFREHCGPGGLHGRDAPAKFNRHYRQRLVLHQPTREALEALAKLNGVLVNYVEVTCDLILKDAASASAWVRLFREGFIQPRHGKMKPVGYAEGGGTRQSPKKGQSSNGHYFDWYSDGPDGDGSCKLTGDPYRFHFEGRYQGARSVRSIGIHGPRDLVDFDFESFFEKRITLYEVDFERLGRWIDNKQTGRRRKRPNISPSGYHFDARRGGSLYLALSLHHDGRPAYSLQQFIDVFRRGPFLTRLKPPYSPFSMLMRTKATRRVKPSPYSRNSCQKDVYETHSRPSPPSSPRTNDTTDTIP